ncbi:AAA family ATPase [Niabella pedocola]|uniref:AAA family ATPase n=1 Tax=Niabella pedocola TaxID=1752077 RepID=A0ABS8PQB1_9BACT|nr:AAA family ATPase [Niabella pedocola]MCD2423296.1 AAA family ATPase [Niabella pedocola]
MIASLYIQSHEYLIDTPQTINFGGKYLYGYHPDGKKLIVSRKPNPKFIPGFFKISPSKCEVQLLSAIVGKNGVGKSSILDSIRSVFADNSHAMPLKKITILVEIEGETKYITSEYSQIFLKENSNKNLLPLEEANKTDFQTIYYSPHFDLKYNPNFDDPDSYDISLDAYTKKDLSETENKGANEHGVMYDLHEELVYKNALRQIEFLNSNEFEKSSFREIFDIPEYKTGILYIRDLEIPSFHNTPYNFRNLLRKILDRLDSEVKDWLRTYRDNPEKNNNKRQLDVDKFQLERFVLKAFISVVINQMERGNDWLNEGYFKKNLDEENINKLSAKELFFHFIENSYLQVGINEKKISEAEVIQNLYTKIVALIANEKDHDNLSAKSIRLNLEDLKEVLTFHRKAITNIIQYYPALDGILPKGNFITGFLDFRPTDRNMSSGETAFLNFFSKLYEFIQNNLIGERKAFEDKNNYILLLDEADLGFHPAWKRKYITALLKTLPYFFESLNVLPKLQIIITTHDPITLSDIPVNNVAFLHKKGKHLAVNDDENKIQRTFGANITDLLADSFFIEDGLIGHFAKYKIEEVITWIKKEQVKQQRNSNYQPSENDLKKMKTTINLIDERIVKIKLAEMLTEVFSDNIYYNNVIDSEIEYLQRRKK